MQVRASHLAAMVCVALCVPALLHAAESTGASGAPAIQRVVNDLVAAWNAADAVAFSRSFQANGTFTNVNGTTFTGKSAFEERHRDIFTNALRGSRVAMTIRDLTYIRSDVAVVNVDTQVTVAGRAPLNTHLLLVLTNEASLWTIAAYHNTSVAAALIVK
jgi:uncharacterized protein (TIGR02246 family)